MSAYRTLREVVVRQPRRERNRRWFSDEDFDLIVWFDGRGAIARFELCYDRSDVERALTWSPTRGYRHWRVDTGDASGLDYAMTPILEPDDTDFPKDRIIAAFVEAADALEPPIRSFVVQRLHEVTGERRSHEPAPHTDPTPPVVTEHEIASDWWNDEQPLAWRRALIATAIATILALAVWLFILWLVRK
jgi:hypothetical protein